MEREGERKSRSEMEREGERKIRRVNSQMLHRHHIITQIEMLQSNISCNSLAELQVEVKFEVTSSMAASASLRSPS